MSKKTGAAIISIFMAFILLAGCSDYHGNEELNMNIGPGGTPLVKEALVDALWENVLLLQGEDVEIDPDAACAAQSSFIIDEDNIFMIMKNPSTEPTDYNSTPVIAVSNISLLRNSDGMDEDDETGSTSCNAQAYMLVASEEAPIDIEVGDSAISKHNIERMAEVEPTPYPVGCRLVVHFERHGGADAKCGDALAPVEDDDDLDEPIIIEPIEVNNLKNSNGGDDNEDPMVEALSDVSCKHDPKLFTLKIVVDDYDCNYSE